MWQRMTTEVRECWLDIGRLTLAVLIVALLFSGVLIRIEYEPTTETTKNEEMKS